MKIVVTNMKILKKDESIFDDDNGSDLDELII